MKRSTMVRNNQILKLLDLGQMPKDIKEQMQLTSVSIVYNAVRLAKNSKN